MSEGTWVLLIIVLVPAFLGTLWVIAMAFIGSTSVLGVLGFAFFDTKNPLKWIGLLVWGAGTWWIWNDASTATELACPPSGYACENFLDWIEKPKHSTGGAVIRTFLGSAVLAAISASLVVWLTDKTEFYLNYKRTTEKGFSDSGGTNKTIGVAEAAEINGVSEGTIRKRLRKGDLSGFKDDQGQWKVVIKKGEQKA